MLIKLAWRNIWRNKRRTLITATSIFLAVLLAVIMRSLQLGAYQNMINNVVGFYYGHIQIHKKGYWNDQTIDNSFQLNDSLINTIDHTPGITRWVPRLESFALASFKNLTKGTLVVGISPNKEKSLTHIDKKLIAGSFLKKGDHAVLMAEGLAKNLELGVNDTLVLLGQGYHGVSAAGKYVIKGLLKFGSPELNSGMVDLPLKEAQSLYGCGNRLTSIAISVGQGGNATAISKKLSTQLSPKKYEVMDWKTMLPDLVQMIEADSSGGIIMIGILYMIIAFGIFGTLLMMIAERKHEFGILIAIGMKHIKLAVIVILELFMISGIGVILGALATFPIVSYFLHNPIHLTGELAQAYQRFGLEPVFPFSNDPGIFSSQALIVLCISVGLSIYPWYSIIKMKAINAMRS